MQREDYIERLIRQIAEFIATIAGFSERARFEEAEQTLDSAWATLGFRRADALRLDDATLRMLLGSKAQLAAKLFVAQAALEERRDHHELSGELRRRAAALS